MIKVAANAQVAVTFAETEAMQFPVMQEMRDKFNVQVKRWDDKELAAYEKAWLEVIVEELARTALQEGCRSLSRFPQKLCHLGPSPGDEGDLPTALVRGDGARASARRRPHRCRSTQSGPFPIATSRCGETWHTLNNHATRPSHWAACWEPPSSSSWWRQGSASLRRSPITSARSCCTSHRTTCRS